MFPAFFKSHPLLHGVWITYYVISMCVASCAVGINFMPLPSKKTTLAAFIYLLIYDMIAFSGGRWIGNNPIFEDDFVVIRRKVRHGYRNMRQTQYDRAIR
jgi:hypothetical protein